MARKKSEPVEKTETTEEAPVIKDEATEIKTEAPVIKAKAPVIKKESVIYAGPALPAGRLNRYTVFRNGTLSPHIKKEIEQCKAISRLIVPVSQLAATESKLKDQTSSEFGWFAEIQKHYRKGATK